VVGRGDEAHRLVHPDVHPRAARLGRGSESAQDPPGHCRGSSAGRAIGRAARDQPLDAPPGLTRIPNRSRSSALPTDDARRRILDAASEAFARHGFKKTSIDDVAKAASVGKGTVYLVCDSKEDLFYQVVHREIRAWVADISK